MAIRKWPDAVRAFFIEKGREGGKIGGVRTAERMTPEERSAKMKRASDAATVVRKAKAEKRRAAREEASRIRHPE